MLSGANDYPYDIKIEGEGGNVKFIATKPDGDVNSPLAMWKLEDWIIIERITAEDAKYNKVFDAMGRFVCKYADRNNATLMVSMSSFEKPKKRSLFNRFKALGFVPNSDNCGPSLADYMERHPGASLALVTPLS